MQIIRGRMDRHARHDAQIHLHLDYLHSVSVFNSRRCASEARRGAALVATLRPSFATSSRSRRLQVSIHGSRSRTENNTDIGTRDRLSETCVGAKATVGSLRLETRIHIHSVTESGLLVAPSCDRHNTEAQHYARAHTSHRSNDIKLLR